MTLTYSLLVALAISAGPGTDVAPAIDDAGSLGHPSIAMAMAVLPVRESAAGLTGSQTWRFDRPERRPGALPAMYATLGVLNVLDVYSTRRAVGAGADEANPLLKPAVGSSATMLAIKALSTVGTVFFAERAWKKNRKGAVVMMALINGTMAAITARNLSNARQ